MIYEHPGRKTSMPVRQDRVFAVCPQGLLEATVLAPAGSLHRPPLLALHGKARNSAEICAAFSEAAAAAGRVVVVPHFDQATWPVFQRINRRARPDRALLALFSTLQGLFPELAGPFDVFGYSGGAQLAHRFAMLYPEIVGDLHLGAAGWYTFPDPSHSYPYGTGSDRVRTGCWGRRMRSGLGAFLNRNITVYVGENDTEQDDSVRSNDALDRQQGRNRLERARHYVDSLLAAQSERDLPSTARLVVLAGCGHSFDHCAQRGGLAILSCAA